MPFRILAMVLSLLALPLAPRLARAQTSTGGGVFLQIEDGVQHGCIDVTKYRVSMQVAALQARRTATFWSRSRTLGGKFDVTITDQDGHAVTFPRGSQLTARGITGDMAMLPTHFPIMSKYLLGGDKPYANVDLRFYIINIEQTSPAAKAMLDFIDMSKSLPLPVNLFAQGMELFGQLAQKVVADSVQTQADTQPVAEFSFDLATSDADIADCPSMALREGVNAVLFEATPNEAAGMLDVARTAEYCFSFDAAQSAVVFRHRVAGACNASEPATRVGNPLVAFVVSKFSLSPAPAVVAALPGPQTLLAAPTPPPAAAMPPPAPVTASPLPAAPKPAVAPVPGAPAITAQARKHLHISPSAESIISTLQTSGGPTRGIRPLLPARPSNPVDEAAAHLHLCAVAGIAPSDCD